MSPVGIALLITVLNSNSVLSFIGNNYGNTYQLTNTRLWYNYFKKGEKKEVGRLLKNIIFPGIYQEYADTKEVLPTVKIDTKPFVVSRNKDIGSFQSQESKSGSYNVGDESCAPKTGMIITKALKPISRPKDFVVPVPKKQSNGGGINVIPNIASYTKQTKPIVIYESEGSDECKKVREACSMLDLTIEYRPCPGALYGYSDLQATITFGNREVPFMVDINPKMYRPQLFGSEEIIKHLFNTYGPGESAIPGSLKGKGGGLGGLFKGGKGSKIQANARPDVTKLKPITIYGWEGISYVKAVRDKMSELGLAHILINCGNGSLNRDKLAKKTGVFQVPYISDPNTGIEMFESAEIIKYLEKTYTV
eukprot:gene4833-6773_t